MILTYETLKRFWNKVNVKSDNECWNWTASKKKHGYGKLGVGKGQEVAHRVSWVIHYGKIPKGMCVCHHCDNPSCVNPKHLFLGVHADNMLDMKKKGRAKGHIGESNPKAILSEPEVIEMRKIYDSHENKYGLTKRMSNAYEVPYGTLQKVVRRYTWNHI